jgi:hypothetical protein
VRHTTLQSTYTTAVQADVISTGELSQLTQQVLRMTGLPTATQDPLGTFQALDRESHTDQDQNTRLALVEFALWHFFYPAGLPIAFSARLFRDKLQELYYFFDPPDQYPALHNSVIVAHSMGGLLSHTVISDSGDELWHRFFEKAPDEVTLSAEVKRELDYTLRFQRSPFIRRIIFVAVPHRGSALSESWAGEIGRMLITTPKTILQTLRLLLEQVGTAMAPDVKAYLIEEDPC